MKCPTIAIQYNIIDVDGVAITQQLLTMVIDNIAKTQQQYFFPKNTKYTYVCPVTYEMTSEDINTQYIIDVLL